MLNKSDTPSMRYLDKRPTAAQFGDQIENNKSFCSINKYTYVARPVTSGVDAR